MKTAMDSWKLWVPVQVVGGAALSLLLGWLMVRGLDWTGLADEVRAFPAHLFFLALAAFLLGIWLRAWRWHVLFIGQRVTFLRLFVIQNAGIGLNSLSPIRVVSAPLQLALVTRSGGVSAATALATLAMQYIMDVFATAFLLGIGVVLMPELRGFSIQLVAAVILGIVSLLVFLLIARGMGALPGARRVAFVHRAVAAAKTLRDSPVRLLLSLLGTLGHWILLGLSGWIIARGLNIDVDVAVVVVLFMGTVSFVSVVPSLPGGALTFEAAVVYTLGLFGIPSEPAFAFAVLMHVIMFGPSILIAVFVLPREGIKMFGRKDPTVVEDTGGKRLP